MHAHDLPSLPWPSGLELVPIAGIVLVLLFTAGLPIPVGYDRGKVKWIAWCGTGMHAHVVCYHDECDGHTDWAGFQSIHPADCGGDSP